MGCERLSQKGSPLALPLVAMVVACGLVLSAGSVATASGQGATQTTSQTGSPRAGQRPAPSQDLVHQTNEVRTSLPDQAAALKAAGDPRHWFAQTYTIVTDNILRQVQSGAFEYPDVVLKDVL